MKKISLLLLLLLITIIPAFAAPSDGTLNGTGIIARDYFKDYYIVDYIVPGSPAYVSRKIHPNDRILKVNSTNEKGFASVDALNSLLNPAAGSTVKVSVKQSGKDDVVEATFHSRNYSPSMISSMKGTSIIEKIDGNFIILKNARGNFRKGSLYLVSFNDKLIGMAKVLEDERNGDVRLVAESLSRTAIKGDPGKKLKVHYYQAAQKYLSVKRPFDVGVERLSKRDLKRNATYLRYARDKKYVKVTGNFEGYDNRSKRIRFTSTKTDGVSKDYVYYSTRRFNLPCSSYVTTLPSNVLPKLSKFDPVIIFFEKNKPRNVKLIILMKR